MEGEQQMPRFSLRHILGLVAVLALLAIGYAAFRPRPTFSTAPATVAPPAARSVSSASAPDEWAMEGLNPARTRALSAGIALPINRQREVRIVGDKGVGSPVAIVQNTLLV